MSAITHGYKVLLIEDNPGDSELIEEMLLELNGIPFTVDKAFSLLDAIKQLAQQDRPDVILVDLFLPDSQGLESLKAVQAHSGDIPIVVLTGMQSDSVGVDAVAKGAQDFLVKMDLTSDLLVRSLRYAMVRGRRNPVVHDSAGPVPRAIGFLGVKGGVGTTSLACHLAAQLKHQTRKAVLTADLDLEGGALGFLLQSQSTFSIADAIENLHHLDAEYWKRIIAPGLGGLHVLKSPAAVGRHQRPTADVAACVLRFARGLYPWIVTDLGRTSEFAANVAVEMDEVFLVTTSELVSLQAARKAIDTLREHGLPANRLHLVHNRAAQRAEGNETIGELTGATVFHSVPDCPADLGAAYIKGQLAAADSSFAQSMEDFAVKLTGIKEPAARSWMSNLRQLFSPEKPSKAVA